ncbi:MAG: DUF86 domain-containing protein [Bacilli bacterium]|nr:DUF86 domain-containing protein [Bacilli bacterium]
MADKNDAYYMEKALVEIEIIIRYTKDLSYEEFMSDGRNIDATIFRLEQMIEQIKHPSPEFQQEHSSIPWGDIIGFRNGLVHEYGKTDYTTVYEVANRDIYELKELFENNIN